MVEQYLKTGVTEKEMNDLDKGKLLISLLYLVASIVVLSIGIYLS